MFICHAYVDKTKFHDGRTVTSIGVLGFPKIEIERGNLREISREILLNSCSSTKEAAQKKERSSEPPWELALAGCFYKLRTKWACMKRWAF